MNTTVIDTLRLSDRLKEAGFEPLRAEGLARALGDELSDRLVTKVDLDEAIQPLNARLTAVELGIQALDTKFDARFKDVGGEFVTIDQGFRAMDQRFEAIDKRFDVIDQRFEAIDKRFDVIDQRFEAIDQRFDVIDQRFEAIDQRFEAIDQRFESTDVKIDAMHREFTGKFNMLLGTVILGFTLLAGIGGYNAVSQQVASSPPPVTLGDATAR